MKERHGRDGRAARCAAPRSGTRSRTASTSNAFGISGGQQQRLCIARCIAVEPDVILMDEPCSALDPIATGKIEDLMIELKEQLHDRDRHPQHAAGGAGLRHAPPSYRRARRPRRPLGPAGRVRRDREDLHQPDRQAHRGLRRPGRSADGRSASGSNTRRNWSSSRRSALGGLDLVSARARAHAGGDRAPGRRAGRSS